MGKHKILLVARLTERLRRECGRKIPNIWLFGAELSSQGSVKALAGLAGAPAQELLLEFQGIVGRGQCP